MMPDAGQKGQQGFQLDVGRSPPRHVERERKKSALVVWVVVCAGLGLVLAVAGLGWWLLRVSRAP